jgi:hypothetical protein
MQPQHDPTEQPAAATSSMLQQYAPQAGDSAMDIIHKQRQLLVLRQVSFVGPSVLSKPGLV